MSKYDYLVVGSGLYGAIIIPEFLNGSLWLPRSPHFKALA